MELQGEASGVRAEEHRQLLDRPHVGPAGGAGHGPDSRTGRRPGCESDREHRSQRDRQAASATVVAERRIRRREAETASWDGGDVHGFRTPGRTRDRPGRRAWISR